MKIIEDNGEISTWMEISIEEFVELRKTDEKEIMAAKTWNKIRYFRRLGAMIAK